MGSFIEFLGQQWLLVGLLLAAVVLLLQYEQRKGGKSLSIHQLVDLVNQRQAVVVDVREPADFKQGHIVDAVNVPSSKMNDRWSELEKFRDRPLVLVCKMGHHSGTAGKVLATNGFKELYRLNGDMMEWQNSQLPLVKA